MIFTPNQIQEIIELVQAYHLNFFAKNIGVSNLLSKVDFNLLNKFGFNISQYMGGNYNSIMDYAFKFGIISTSLQEVVVKNMSYYQLQKYIQSGKFIPLTKYEKDVLQSVKTQSLKDIKNLSNRIGSDIQGSVTQIEREDRVREMIREEAIETVKNRESVKSLVSRLGNKTGDWNRDWGRISDYIMHTAFDEGRAVGIEREHGKDAEVYKDVYVGACKYCSEIYTTEGVGTKPKIFKLVELVDNGTNIGRKASEYKPVIGSTHPNCRCTLHLVPLDYEWNPETKMWDIMKKWERKVQRKSKVKLTINNKKEVYI